MKQEVIKEMGTAELIERLEEQRKHLTKLKLNHAVSPLDNPNQITVNRKAIARIQTELRKREILENKQKES
jgi:large subunit ribosomal protein L29